MAPGPSLTWKGSNHSASGRRVTYGAWSWGDDGRRQGGLNAPWEITAAKGYPALHPDTPGAAAGRGILES